MQTLGINLLYLVPSQVGGTEIYARRLVEALANERPDLEIVCFCGIEAAEVLPDPSWPANVRVVKLPVRCANKAARIAAEMVLLPRFAAREGVDLLHSLGTTAPLHGRFTRVTTVHDIIYDHYPEAFPTAARAGLKLIVPRAARRSHRVQVSSTATKHELLEHFDLAEEQIDVVPLGLGMQKIPEPAAESQLRERFELGDAPVVLTVSAALPHKNLGRLLDAFPDVSPANKPVLVVAGHSGRKAEELRVQAARLGIQDRVRFTGWLGDAEIEGLYQLASVFVYPSLHEGFGMPVLEAMRRGVPTTCSNTTSLPEVVGDAALLFDPKDTSAIAQACEQLLSDQVLAANLVEKGYARANSFTWERSAQAALDSYSRALQTT